MILSGKKMDLLVNPKLWITYEEVINESSKRPLQNEEGLELDWSQHYNRSEKIHSRYGEN